MIEGVPGAVTRIRHAAWRVACLSLLLFSAGGLWAQAEDEGRFEVLEGSHRLVDGVYYVDARIELRLPQEAVNALRSRVPLTILIEVQFLNRLRFWWDLESFSAYRRLQLYYYPLTDRYVVRDTDTNDREDFVTLSGALEFMGRLDGLRVVEAAEVDEDRRYDVRVRAVLDKDDFPGPLRFFAFWRRDWSLASDWLQWRLDDD